MQTETQKLAEWACGLSLAAIPEEGRRLVASAFLDTLGVTVSGTRMPAARIVAGLERDASGCQAASVLGMGRKAEPRRAALINGTSAHAEIFDDNNGPMIGHPSASLVSALMPLAQVHGLDGRSLVEAYAVGLEVAVKLARALNPGLYENGWHATRVFGVIGAAAACCRLLRLDAGRTAHAMGIAVSMAGSLRQNFGTTAMALHIGMTARDAIHAALLAQAGLEADPRALEGRYGLYRAFGDAEARLPPLEGPLELIASGLIFKLYPSGAPALSAIAAALELRRASGLTPPSIESIECLVHPWNAMTLRDEIPATPVHGKVNMRFCVAAALVYGEVTYRQFTEEALHHPEVVRLMQRIRISQSADLPDSDEFPAELRVTATGGATFTQRCEVPPGGSGRPLTREQLAKKFRDCTEHRLAPADIARAADLIGRLESLDEVRTLCELLEGPPMRGEGA